MNGSNDRRRYYRIDDTLLLRYSAEKESAAAADNNNQDHIELSTGILLGKSDRELNDAIEKVYNLDPVIAKAMGLLNRKISALATQLLGTEALNVDPFYKAKVNLSGCGISFAAREPWSVGDRLHIGLLVRPGQVPVELFGTIIHVRYVEGDSDAYWLRVDFDENEHSQDQIIQYVVQRQGALLSDWVSSRGQ